MIKHMYHMLCCIIRTVLQSIQFSKHTSNTGTHRSNSGFETSPNWQRYRNSLRYIFNLRLKFIWCIFYHSKFEFQTYIHMTKKLNENSKSCLLLLVSNDDEFISLPLLGHPGQPNSVTSSIISVVEIFVVE